MTLPRIRLLPPELRDQIAAGEVVERPSSVVKELVENALDAGARTVRVEIDGGGLDRILVVDDGHGMERDDALLALERHATSKLAEFADLYRLSTFGFRGEAIPSIAAVSRLTITTRTVDAVAAIEVVAAPGGTPQTREVGAPSGTSIEVRELFANVPARRKFLKSVGTEAGHVGDACLELALARHDLALTFARDGRVARQWLRAPDRQTRGRDVLARAMEGARSLSLAHVVGERGKLRVEALLAPPERARSGATGLHLLVNGRAIRDRHVARAVAMAYGSLLDPGRYPLGIVWIDVPSDEVDVNVHPQKAEVRFARGRELYDDVTRAIGGALSEQLREPGSSASIGAERQASFLESRAVSALFPSPPTLDERPRTVGDAARTLSDAMARGYSPIPDAPFVSRSPAAESDPWGLVEAPRPTVPGPSPNARSSPPAAPHLPEQPPLSSTLAGADLLAVASAAQAIRGELRYSTLRFLAQVRSTWLLCEGSDGVYVLDQHAAAERVNFARLREQFQARSVARQQLLVPEIVQVRSAETGLVEELRDDLLALGVDARVIGDGRVAVHGVPALLRRTNPEQILRDVLDELGKTGERKFGDAIDLVLATMACHGSVRAGDTLHPDEAAALLADLDTVDFAGYCPHGRPVVTVLPFADLERRVGRR
ncbi:MAG: DNA mismatch repair endonuclease MutL [Deltaproteobacteria bacterium]|nr:DNA mismatch repair endonuclease MutL [Deltaproteobacteria bacterium]